MAQKELVILGGPEYPYFNDECFNWKITRLSVKCPMPGIFVEVNVYIKNWYAIS